MAAPINITVEGGIAVGKSRFAAALAAHLHTHYEGETHIEDDTHITNRLFQAFQASPAGAREHAAMFQVCVAIDRWSAARHTAERGGGVIERGIYGSAVFAIEQARCGNISPPHAEGYTHVHEKLQADMAAARDAAAPALIVHVRAPAERAAARLAARIARGTRPEEASLPLSYLQGLVRTYDAVLEDAARAGIAVVTLDWDWPDARDEPFVPGVPRGCEGAFPADGGVAYFLREAAAQAPGVAAAMGLV